MGIAADTAIVADMRDAELTAAAIAADTLVGHAVALHLERVAEHAAAVDLVAAAMQVAAVATAAADTGKVERGSSHERPVCFCRRAFLLR
jgi:hypothetical protein